MNTDTQTENDGFKHPEEDDFVPGLTLVRTEDGEYEDVSHKSNDSDDS